MDARQIQTLRARIGLTTLKLAEQLGVPQQLVLDWESAARFPTLRHVQALVQLEAAAVAPQADVPAVGAAAESLRAPRIDAEFAELLRKLLAHPALYAEVTRLAQNFSDPEAVSLPKP
jgi:transcriptional regulator with XRE-family HTH domain